MLDSNNFILFNLNRTYSTYSHKCETLLSTSSFSRLQNIAQKISRQLNSFSAASTSLQKLKTHISYQSIQEKKSAQLSNTISDFVRFLLLQQSFYFLCSVYSCSFSAKEAKNGKEKAKILDNYVINMMGSSATVNSITILDIQCKI